MQKPWNLGLKSLDQMRSANGPPGGPSKVTPVLNSDMVPLGALANLKLTVEKLINEQASVKTDLEMANSKLRRSAEQVHILEAKLQEAMNENSKLKVKNKEDAKLWNSLDLKLSSTKTLCDQLTETLHRLDRCTQDAEKDKCYFEEKLLQSSRAFDCLDCRLNELSAKLDNAKETIRTGEQEILRLEHEKQDIEKKFEDRCYIGDSLRKERDTIAEELRSTIEANKAHSHKLISQMEELQRELKSKENNCVNLTSTINNLEDEKSFLLSSKEYLSKQLDISSKETKNLEDILHGLWKQIEEMDKQNLTTSDNAIQLLSSFETFEKMIQEEKDLIMKNTQQKLDELHGKLCIVSSENESLTTEAEILRNKVVELQKSQEFIMVQHAEECRIVEDKVRKLESENNSLVSKKSELDALVAQLNDKNNNLLEVRNIADKELRDSLAKASILESENQDIKTKMQVSLREKAEEINNLQNEVANSRQKILSLEDEIYKLQMVLHEKDEQILQCCEREKLLEEQKLEIQASLASTECGLIEARKQYDLMLETKQLELSRHLKEISQRNDQAISDIKKKYETEKLEIVNMEKEKIEKLVMDMERKCDEKLEKSKEEAQRHLHHIQEENDELAKQLRKEHEKKELDLRASHVEELQRLQLQNESELREKTTIMRKEHEMRRQVLEQQHKDECRKLQEELDILRSKEDKQRALLQLQWKVMDERSQQNDVEVSSKKENSISSTKMRDTNVHDRNQLVPSSQETAKKEVDLSEIMQTPVTNILKKVEKGSKDNVISIPKQSKKVTRHEYEIETSNGRTITKRRKTKSTVMFGDPITHEHVNQKTPRAVDDIRRLSKAHRRTQGHPPNMGDLFSEGSLNPYADDPYAFD